MLKLFREYICKVFGPIPIEQKPCLPVTVWGGDIDDGMFARYQREDGSVRNVPMEGGLFWNEHKMRVVNDKTDYVDLDFATGNDNVIPFFEVVDGPYMGCRLQIPFEPTSDSSSSDRSDDGEGKIVTDSRNVVAYGVNFFLKAGTILHSRGRLSLKLAYETKLIYLAQSQLDAATDILRRDSIENGFDIENFQDMFDPKELNTMLFCHTLKHYRAWTRGALIRNRYISLFRTDEIDMPTLVRCDIVRQKLDLMRPIFKTLSSQSMLVLHSEPGEDLYRTVNLRIAFWSTDPFIFVAQHAHGSAHLE